MKSKEKKLAIEMRNEGVSIKEIARVLRVSKSSASIWVRNIDLTPQQRKKLSLNGFSIDVIEKRRRKRLENENDKRRESMLEAGKDIVSISSHELKLLGIIFYWAEGGKSRKGMVRVSNSDPAVIQIMMRFFREICRVPDEKFRGLIHTHSHLNVKNAERY